MGPEILNEQIDYYRARAAEYDRWFQRLGRYSLGPEENERWFGELRAVQAALDDLGPVGDTLELACGTGLWTSRLAPMCASLTAVDAAPEMLTLNRERIGSNDIDYVQADLFAWEPQRTYDLVFFGFWLSHVPGEEFAGFWDKVRRALKPGAHVFLVDNLWVPGRVDHSNEDPKEGTMTRELEDGRCFRIVKVFHEPEALTELLTPMGWTCDLHRSGRYLLYGTAST